MAIATKSKSSKKSNKGHTNKEKVVNSVTPGSPIELNLQDKEVGPLQTVKIENDKRIEDTTGRLERMIMIDTFSDIYKQDSAYLKAECVKHGAKYIMSAHGAGQISGSGTGRYINVEKFLAMVKQKKVKQADYLPAMSISIDKCKPFLSENEINEICDTPGIPPAPRFGVALRKDVPQMNIVEAINGLAAEFKIEKVPAPIESK